MVWAYGGDPKHITVGRSTTYVLGPVEPDGSVHYVRAFNELQRAAAGTRRNAADVVLSILPPRDEGLGSWNRERSPREVALYSAQATERRFISPSAYAAATRDPNGNESVRSRRIDEQLTACAARPWQPREIPDLAAWLDANGGVLDLLSSLEDTDAFFIPYGGLVYEDGEMCVAGLPDLDELRCVAEAFAARAMLRVGEGRAADAWADILAGKRLACLVGTVPSTETLRLSWTMWATIFRAEQALLLHQPPSPSQAAGLLARTRALPSTVTYAQAVGTEERFQSLSLIMLLYRGVGYKSLYCVVDHGIPPDGNAKHNIDYDYILSALNAVYDDQLPALEQPSLRGCLRARSPIPAIGRPVSDNFRTLLYVLRACDWGGRASRPLATRTLLGALCPTRIDWDQETNEWYRFQAQRMLGEHALHLYARGGGLPTDAGDRRTIPLDPFTGDPIEYRVLPGGLSIICTGVNLSFESQADYDAGESDDVLLVLPVLPAVPPGE